MITCTLITYLSFTTFAIFFPTQTSKDAGGGLSNVSENSEPDRGPGKHFATLHKLDEMGWSIRDVLEKDILLRYAAESWGNHAREALVGFSVEGIGNRLNHHLIATNVQEGRVTST